MNLGKLQRIRRVATEGSESRPQGNTPETATEGRVDARDGDRWPEGVAPPW